MVKEGTKDKIKQIGSKETTAGPKGYNRQRQIRIYDQEKTNTPWVPTNMLTKFKFTCAIEFFSIIYFYAAYKKSEGKFLNNGLQMSKVESDLKTILWWQRSN